MDDEAASATGLRRPRQLLGQARSDRVFLRRGPPSHQLPWNRSDDANGPRQAASKRCRRRLLANGPEASKHHAENTNAGN